MGRGQAYSLTVKTGGGRRRKRANGADLVAVVVLVCVATALWRVMSWWIVSLVVVPLVLVIAARQSEVLHRHRRKLAPLGVGLLVAAAACVARLIDNPWSWAVFAAAALMLGWACTVVESADQRKFRAAALLLGSAWVAAVQLMPAHRWPDLAATWLVLVVLGSGMHLMDRKVIAEVKVEEKIRSWPEIVKGTELAGTWRTSFAEKPEGGWRMRVAWAPGKRLLKSVKTLGPLFESLMDAPVGSVSVEAGDRPNEVTVECSPVGALGALEWDGQVAVSITQPMPQARYGDGSYEDYARWVVGVGGRSKLRAGMSRSGKSVAMKHDALIYGCAEDVVLWLIDLKGGASLRPLAPLADWFVTTQEQAVAMLEAAARLCDWRAHQMAEWGWDPWQPSREHPVILIQIDETAKLLGFQAPAAIQTRALAAATTVAQQGLGLGIIVDPATQFATLEALGSSQFREQLTITECYRMRSEGTAQHFLPNAPAGVEPAHLPASQKGSHYSDIEGEFRPLVAQKFNVTAEQVTDLVAEFWDSTPSIEQAAWPVLGEAWAGRQQWAMVDGKVVRADATSQEMPRDDTADDDEDLSQPVSHDGATTEELLSQAAVVDLSHLRPAWAGVEDGDAPTFRELEAARLASLSPEERAAQKAAHVAALERSRPTDPAQAPALVLQLMRDVAPEPVSPGDAQRVTGLSESTVHRLLRRWEDEGRVTHVGYGRYTLVEVPVTAP